MDWTIARERLGAELIAAREEVAARWRLALRDQDAMPSAVDACAAELVLHAGAALADGMPVETPWRRCGGLLRIDARDTGRALVNELSLLWRSMTTAVAQRALNVDEHEKAREALAAQLDAAIRGAVAELRATLLDEPVEDERLRFGGVKAICWSEPPVSQSADRAA